MVALLKQGPVPLVHETGTSPLVHVIYPSCILI